MERIYKDESANKGGIYRILNRVNGKFYVGSTVRFRTRFDQHEKQLQAGKHTNTYLQNAFIQNGTDAFVFEVLEVIDGSKDLRLLKEQEYLDKHFDGMVNCYNLRKEAISREGSNNRNPAESRRKRLANPNTQRTIFKSGNQHPYFGKVGPCKGRKVSETTKLKLSQAHFGNPGHWTGKARSEETKKKISDSLKGKPVSEETKRKWALYGRYSKK